jgi:hypothetical protein
MISCNCIIFLFFALNFMVWKETIARQCQSSRPRNLVVVLQGTLDRNKFSLVDSTVSPYHLNFSWAICCQLFKQYASEGIGGQERAIFQANMPSFTLEEAITTHVLHSLRILVAKFWHFSPDKRHVDSVLADKACSTILTCTEEITQIAVSITRLL